MTLFPPLILYQFSFFFQISVAILLTAVWAQQPHHDLQSSPLAKLRRISRRTDDPNEPTRPALLSRKLAIGYQPSKFPLDDTSATSRTRRTAIDSINFQQKLPKTLIEDIFQKSRLAVDSNPTKKSQKKIEGKIASDSTNTAKIPAGLKLPKKIEIKAAPVVDIPPPKIKLGQLPRSRPSIATEPRHTAGEFSSKFKKPTVDTDYNKRSYHVSNDVAVSPSSRKGTGNIAFPNFRKPSVEGSNPKHRTAGDVLAPVSLPRSSASMKLPQGYDHRDIDNSRIRRGPVDVTATASSPRPNNLQLHPKLANGLSRGAHRVANNGAGSSS